MGNTLQEDARSGGHHHQIRQFGITSQVSITVMNKQTFFNLFEFEIVYSGGQLFVPSHNCHIYRKRWQYRQLHVHSHYEYDADGGYHRRSWTNEQEGKHSKSSEIICILKQLIFAAGQKSWAINSSQKYVIYVIFNLIEIISFLVDRWIISVFKLISILSGSLRWDCLRSAWHYFRRYASIPLINSPCHETVNCYCFRLNTAGWYNHHVRVGYRSVWNITRIISQHRSPAMAARRNFHWSHRHCIFQKKFENLFSLAALQLTQLFRSCFSVCNSRKESVKS